MILHYESRGRERSPERRVLSIGRQSDSTVVATTVPGFARELGAALLLTYSGSLCVQYSHERAVAHVYWRR